MDAYSLEASGTQRCVQAPFLLGGRTANFRRGSLKARQTSGGYGVWWNRHSVKQRAVTEPDQTRGKRYSKRTFVTLRSEGEWVGVPVSAYLNRPLVDLARDTLGATGASSANTPAGSGS
jgi:hypothetical protein